MSDQRFSGTIAPIGARQQLASAATASERDHTNHLKRAFRGALIALLIFVLVFFWASRLSAVTIPGHGVTVMALDLSKSTTPESFKANVNSVSEVLTKLQPSDRAVVLGITDRFGRPAILLDKTLPPEAGFLSLQLQAGREKS